MFTKAIVRRPSCSISSGLSGANLGQPNYEASLLQHAAYVQALKNLGLDVIELEAIDNLADATFVEDVALLVDDIAAYSSPCGISNLS